MVVWATPTAAGGSWPSWLTCGDVPLDFQEELKAMFDAMDRDGDGCGTVFGDVESGFQPWSGRYISYLEWSSGVKLSEINEMVRGCKHQGGSARSVKQVRCETSAMEESHVDKGQEQERRHIKGTERESERE